MILGISEMIKREYEASPTSLERSKNMNAMYVFIRRKHVDT